MIGTVSQNLLLRVSLLSSLVLASACGDDSSAGGSGGSGGSGGEGAGSAGGPAGGNNPDGGGDTGGSGGGVEVELPVAEACDAPTVHTGSSWAPAAGERFSSPRLAYNATGAAVAYVESTGDSSWEVKLQQLTANGQKSGSPVSLGNTTMPRPPNVTIAETPSGFVTCWDVVGNSGGEFACAAVDSGGTSATAGFTRAGSRPSVALGPAGVGLVYGSGNGLYSQLLDKDGAAVGGDHEVATSTGASPADPVAAGMSGGYAAVAPDWTGILWRFSAGFEELEGQTDIGWAKKPTSMAGTGTSVGAAWPDAANGVVFKRVDAENNVVGPTRVDDEAASSIYQYTAVARGAGGTFAVAWSAFEGYVGYRAIGADGLPRGEPVEALPSNWDDNPVTIVGVTDGFLLASAINPGYDEIVVVHLACR